MLAGSAASRARRATASLILSVSAAACCAFMFYAALHSGRSAREALDRAVRSPSLDKLFMLARWRSCLRADFIFSEHLQPLRLTSPDAMMVG